MPCEVIVVEALGNDRFRVNGRVAHAVKDKERVWVFLEGRSYLIEGDARDNDIRAHSTDDQMALSAPMPATVVAITATPGQEVAAGDLLVMLEAMKMELPIRAPRAGRVKALACHEGELVQAGVPLVEME